jgi:N-acetylglucosaminyldiphosphoundecaprenol N-acetyl-beta-D-mannosaminyltransferase
MKHVDEFSLRIHSATMKESIELACGASRDDPVLYIDTNAATIVNSQTDKEFQKALRCANMGNCDGQAVVWALKILGHGEIERVAGCDLFQELVKECAARELRPFFLGAKEESLQEMLAVFRARFPLLKVAGARNGYFDDDEEEQIIKVIRNAEPDMLFLGMTSPKKELFMYKHGQELTVPFTMGVGGSFDIVSGRLKRAPEWMQRGGLEWFYRVIQEPRRLWKRYALTNSVFIFMVFRALARRILAWSILKTQVRR